MDDNKQTSKKDCYCPKEETRLTAFKATPPQKPEPTPRGSAYTMALTPRQYRSHMLRNRGCPPMSQICNADRGVSAAFPTRTDAQRPGGRAHSQNGPASARLQDLSSHELLSGSSWGFQTRSSR